MIESFVFTSQDGDIDHEFARYRDLYSQGANVSLMGQRFAAEVRSWRLDRLILFDRRVTGVVHERPAPRVQNDGFSHFTLTLVKQGLLTGSETSGFSHAQVGQIVVQDMRRPTHTTIEKGRIITVSVARDLIEAAVGSAGSLHGRVIPSEDGGLLADYLTSLCERAPGLRTDDVTAVSRAFVELVGLAFSSVVGGAKVELAREDFARREAVQRFIEQNLEREDLSTALIVSGAGLSRSMLYRLMEPHGGVARFVTARRIARVRATIEDLTQEPSLADLAERFAFSSAPRLSAKFKAVFGLTPTAYRRMISDPDQTVAALRQRWAAWMVEVR